MQAGKTKGKERRRRRKRMEAERSDEWGQERFGNVGYGEGRRERGRGGNLVLGLHSCLLDKRES